MSDEILLTTCSPLQEDDSGKQFYKASQFPRSLILWVLQNVTLEKPYKQVADNVDENFEILSPADADVGI